MAACKLTKEGINPCPGLKGVLQYDGRGTRKQGVELRTLINMKTGKFSRHLPIIKSGEHGKDGIIMNFCPFCRNRLWKSMREKKAA